MERYKFGYLNEKIPLWITNILKVVLFYYGYTARILCLKIDKESIASKALGIRKRKFNNPTINTIQHDNMICIEQVMNTIYRNKSQSIISRFLRILMMT